MTTPDDHHVATTARPGAPQGSRTSRRCARRATAAQRFAATIAILAASASTFPAAHGSASAPTGTGDDGSFWWKGDLGGRRTDPPPPPPPPPRVPCSWHAVPTSDRVVAIYNAAYAGIDDFYDRVTGTDTVAYELTFYNRRGTLGRWNQSRARFESYQVADCEGATDLTEAEQRGSRWVRTPPPSAGVLIPGLRLTVRGAVTPPRPAINPPTRAPIGLGLWLAVSNTRPVVAEGRLGPLWARGTATLTTTSFSPGNGAPAVVCPGGGTPLTDVDAVDAGPCGYTYTSLADVRSNLTITITSTWTVTWQTSDRDAGATSPETITLTTRLPYDVFEIQTVGGSAD